MSMEEQNRKPAGDTVRVLFPCVHGQSAGQFITINCFIAEELKGSIKVVSGVDEEVARRVIGATRYRESDGRAGKGVIALFSSSFFSGESYGLALAVGDKLARYGLVKQWDAIYATGRILADHRGEVDMVEGFDEKVNLVLQMALPGSLFLYPHKNAILEGARGKLALLSAKGIECISVADLNELQDKVWLVSGRHKKVVERQRYNFHYILDYFARRKIRLGLTLLAICSLAGCLLAFSTFEDPVPENRIGNNAETENTTISHQVIKQIGNDISVEDTQAPEQSISNRIQQKETQTPILESVQVDPDAY